MRCSLALRCLLLWWSLQAVAQAQSYESALLDGVAARDRALDTNSERDWQRALQHFERAVAQESTKEAQFELAEAAAHLGLSAQAYASYEVALALGLQGRARSRADEFLSAHEAEVARVDVRGPAGATLWLGGRQQATLPLARALVVSPGELQLRLEQPGFQSQELHVSAAAATLQRIDVVLLPLPVAPERSQGTTEPPLMGPTVTGRASSPDRQIGAPAAPWAKPLLVTGSALALVGAGTFVTSVVLLSDAREDLAQLCDTPDPDDPSECLATRPSRIADAQAAADRAQTFENLRWVGVAGFAVGVAAAGLGLWQLLASNGEAAQAMLLRLELSPQHASFEWSGRF